MWPLRRIEVESEVPERFHVERIRIRRRDVRDYVLAKGKHFFGEGFFYAYAFSRDGVLSLLLVEEDGRFRRGMVPVLASLLLAQIWSDKWLWLTAFVGLNLVQSFFTNWCPMMTLLEKLGVKRC